MNFAAPAAITAYDTATQADFFAALSASVTDDYETTSGYPPSVALLTDATMSAVLGETTYTTTNDESVLFETGSDFNTAYCAGCNGSFILDFTTTSVGTSAGVFGVGVYFANSQAPLYSAFITFGDDSTTDIPLPLEPCCFIGGLTAFFGISSDLAIKSIHFGLGGTATNMGAFAIDDLTIGSNGTVVPPTPEEQIDDVSDVIDELEEGGDVAPGPANALTAKLDAARRQAETNPDAAIGQLNAFINQVMALVRRGTLTFDDGQALIQAASDIIADLDVDERADPIGVSSRLTLVAKALVGSDPADIVTDVDTVSQTGTLDPLSVSVSAFASSDSSTILTQGSASATWLTPTWTEVVFEDLGWTIENITSGGLASLTPTENFFLPIHGNLRRDSGPVLEHHNGRRIDQFWRVFFLTKDWMGSSFNGLGDPVDLSSSTLIRLARFSVSS